MLMINDTLIILLMKFVTFVKIRLSLTNDNLSTPVSKFINKNKKNAFCGKFTIMKF